MLLAGDNDEDVARSHSPFKGVAGKQTFFERPDNEKDYSQDDMSLKDQRHYENFQFHEEPYVPVAVAQQHISLMENDMRRMKDNYGKTMKDLELGYLRLEEKTHEIYKRTLGAWKNNARNKIKQFQDSLKKAIDERNEIESNLKERLKKQRLEKERLEKEKAFLLTENQAGKDEIQEKARLLEDIKATYTGEIKGKDEEIDQRENYIEQLKDEQEQTKAKFEEERAKLDETHQTELAEIKQKLDDETSKREQFEERCQELEEQIRSGGGVAAAPVMYERAPTQKDRQKSMFDGNDSESEIRSLTSAKQAKGESAALNIVAPVGSAAAIAASGNFSTETKELLERIDKLEEEKAVLEDDKVELAKAVTNLNELLKECRNQMKTQQQQIDDAERQGAEILPVEVAEERNKVALKKSKTLKKKKTRIRDAEVDEEEDEVFKGDENLKRMVDNLVPEEDRDNAVEEAKRVMLIHNSKNEDLEKEVTKLSKENEMLKKSLEELKKRSQGDTEIDVDSLQEENRALIAQIKNLKKEKNEVQRQLTNVQENHQHDSDESVDMKEDSDNDDASPLAARAPVASSGPCKKCAKLQESINDLEEKLAILEEESIHIKTQLSREQDKSEKLDEELSEMRKNYSELVKQKTVKAGKVDAVLAQQIEQLTEENKELKEHNKNLDKKTQPTKRLEVKLDKKDKEIDKLHEKIEALQKKNDKLEDQLDGAPSPGKKKSPKKGAASSDTRALKAKEKELSKLKSKLEKLEDRVETLTITAEARKEEVKNLHQINKEQEREIKSYKGEVGALGKEKDRSLKKAQKALAKENSAAEAKKKELEKKLEQSKGKLGEEIKTLKAELKETTEDYESRMKIMKEQSVALNTQLDEAEQGIKDRDKQIKKLEKRMEEMGEQVGEAEKLLQEHKELKKQLKEMTNEYGLIEVKYKEEVKKRKKLHNQIEDMKGKVRVFARARPMSDNEKKKGCKSICSIPDEMTIQVETKNGPKKYNFDNCFGPDSTQEEVFEESCALIQSAIDGFNVCVFAYGQTGSGKTFTIQGDAKNPGLTPRIFEELFTILDSMDNFEISLSCYMVELYLENLKDLLKPKKAEEVDLQIKKNAHGMVIVEGAHEIPIESLQQANKIFEYGLDNRKTASTNMNATSSRSHLVFGIVINSRNKQTGQKTVGKLSLVDLAGSERVSKTGATKDRLQEALAINKSLSALGNVISALGDGKKKHVPYRDNKLTMLMEDSLGGNAKTLMFVNVSPADYNADETNTSLGYAKRVKNIKNFAVKNTKSKQTDKMNAIIMELQGEIARLERKLEDGGINFRRTNTNFNIEDEDGDEEEFDPEQD